MAGIYDERIIGAKQQAETARKLREGITSPQGQMVSGWYVPPSITQYMANALKSYGAGKEEQTAQSEYERMQKQKETETANILRQLEPQASVQVSPEMANAAYGQGDINSVMANPTPQTQTTYQPVDERTRMAALLRGAAVNPEAFQPQMQMAQWDIGRQDKRETAQQATDLKREQMDMQRQNFQSNEQLRRDMMNQSSADRRYQADAMNAIRQQKNIPKLPTSALKMQQEELDAIGTTASINADLSALGKQVDSGELNLGLVNNLTSKAKNFMGVSDEQSRNMATFQASLEKLRNDSLRLNKGVQTEGDAVRAWNEMLVNINDPKLVKQRLAEIQKINERAGSLRRMNVDVIRSNFGVDTMDTGNYQNQPAAVGGSGVRRFNPATGQLE